MVKLDTPYFPRVVDMKKLKSITFTSDTGKRRRKSGEALVNSIYRLGYTTKDLQEMMGLKPHPGDRLRNKATKKVPAFAYEGGRRK
jgi:hypothetical protein